MKYLITIFLLASLFFSSEAQMTQQYYGTAARSEVILDSKVISTGGYISVGYSFLPSNSTNTDCLISKMDTTGNVLWTKELATTNIDQLNTVIETFDGNFVAVGYINATGSYSNNTAIAIKFNPSGTILWNRQFNATIPGETFLDVVEIPVSHDILCAGAYNFSPGINSGLVVSLNSLNGNTNWAKTYDIAGSNAFHGITALNNTIYLTGIFQGISYYDGYLISLNASNGNINWDKSYNYTSILQGGTNCNWFWKPKAANGKVNINSWITNDYSASSSLTACLLEIDSLGNNPTCLEMKLANSNYSLNSSLDIANGDYFFVQHPSQTLQTTSNLADAVISKFSSLIVQPSSIEYSKFIQNTGNQSISSISVFGSKLIGAGQSVNDPIQIGNTDCFQIISDTSLASFNACNIVDTTILTANPIVSSLPFSFTTIQTVSFANQNLQLLEISPNYSVVVICNYNPVLSIIVSNNSICEGSPVTLTAVNGGNYVWSGGVVNGVPFYPNSTNTYTVTSTSATGSISTATATVVVNPLPSITSAATPNPVCAGASTILSAAGANTYTWSGGVTNGVPFSPLTTSTYTVIGTDANGCTNTSSTTVTVLPIPNLIANASPSSLCLGASTVLTASGANIYSWSGGVQNGVSFVPTATTTYTVTGTNSNGCSSTSTVTVNILNSLNITVVPPNPSLCIGDSLLLTASGATNYTWVPITAISNPNLSTVLVYPTVPTTYTITGVDASGCSGSTAVTIGIDTYPSLEVSKSGDIECGDKSIQLTASGATAYAWMPSNLVSNSNSGITTASLVTATTFTVTGTNGSCAVTDSIFVYYFNNDENSIFIPSAFSPNGDGKNDCLVIKEKANFKEFSMVIYNRWGQRVFETANPKSCWDGYFMSEPALVGTYYFYLRGETKCGPIFKKGDITLVR